MQKKTKILIGVGVVLAIGVGVYLWKKKKSASTLVEKDSSAPDTKKPTHKVEKIEGLKPKVNLSNVVKR